MTHPLHVLIVEDNDDDVVLIDAAFEEALGGSYTIVRDGEQAMAYVRHEADYVDATPPDLVLLDINMPRKDGLEVLHEIKHDPELRHLPVIMFTTSSRESDILRCYDEGAASYVVKPMRFEELKATARGLAAYWSSTSRLPSVCPLVL